MLSWLKAIPTLQFWRAWEYPSGLAFLQKNLTQIGHYSDYQLIFSKARLPLFGELTAAWRNFLNLIWFNVFNLFIQDENMANSKEINQVVEAFELWRNNRGSRKSPTPQALRKQAIDLLEHCSCSKVTSMLRIRLSIETMAWVR
jgi:hypothetical protein